MNKTLTYSLLACCLCLPAACDLAYEPKTGAASEPPQALSENPAAPLTPAAAAAFVAEAEQRLAELGQHHERMAWVLANFITGDTELLAARTAEDFTAAQVEMAGQAVRFSDIAGM